MAIYDVDAIRESELMEAEADSDSVLDNMLEACDSMMESIACIDEGARQKYIDMLGDKQAKINKRMKEIKIMKDAATSDTAIKKFDSELSVLRRKYDELADKASNYSAKVGMATGMYEKDEVMRRGSGGRKITDEEHDKYDEKRNIRNAVKKSKSDKDFKKNSSDLGAYNRYGLGSYSHSDHAFEKSAKANFNRDFGLNNQKEDKVAKKKPGAILDAQNKKRAIKETCLTILSVLDEI